ncbi:hypothetical protein QTH97_09910 [Variovorax sp. J22R24]|uniref:hypothetical protein n=1 Tax=Variovorax gracilis TaxID=3053502 RepID=UPI002577DE8A|nr:hypothetical protein [Variovorax sp. J22R24]MDM0105246.1 hypothetical protein [Variovorax sp. J22R24]
MAALTACGAAGGLTGAVAGLASGAATSNPAVGVAIGIGVQAGVDESVKAAMRYLSREEQDRIAAMVGQMAVGERLPWEVRHPVPYGNKQGEVTVVREFTTPLAACKEAAFSVEDIDAEPTTPSPVRFVTTACHGANGWKWATAEPSVFRWGTLH